MKQYNDKDLKIIRLYEKGLTDGQIARKLGYSGGSVQKGLEKIREIISIYKEEHGASSNKLNVKKNGRCTNA